MEHAGMRQMPFISQQRIRTAGAGRHIAAYEGERPVSGRTRQAAARIVPAPSHSKALFLPGPASRQRGRRLGHRHGIYPPT